MYPHCSFSCLIYFVVCRVFSDYLIYFCCFTCCRIAVLFSVFTVFCVCHIFCFYPVLFSEYLIYFYRYFSFFLYAYCCFSCLSFTFCCFLILFFSVSPLFAASLVVFPARAPCVPWVFGDVVLLVVFSFVCFSFTPYQIIVLSCSLTRCDSELTLS